MGITLKSHRETVSNIRYDALKYERLATWSIDGLPKGLQVHTSKREWGTVKFKVRVYNCADPIITVSEKGTDTKIYWESELQAWIRLHGQDGRVGLFHFFLEWIRSAISELDKAEQAEEEQAVSI